MTPRRMSVVLIVSVALNLFLLASALTLVALRAHEASHRLPRRPTLRAAAVSLDPEPRSRFVALLRAEGESVQGANHEARALRDAAWGLLAAPTFDPAVARADLARARALNEASRAKVENSVLDFAAGLPAIERARFGAAMRRPSPGQDPPAPGATGAPP